MKTLQHFKFRPSNFVKCAQHAQHLKRRCMNNFSLTAFPETRATQRWLHWKGKVGTITAMESANHKNNTTATPVKQFQKEIFSSITHSSQVIKLLQPRRIGPWLASELYQPASGQVKGRWTAVVRTEVYHNMVRDPLNWTLKQDCACTYRKTVMFKD